LWQIGEVEKGNERRTKAGRTLQTGGGGREAWGGIPWSFAEEGLPGGGKGYRRCFALTADKDEVRLAKSRKKKWKKMPKKRRS